METAVGAGKKNCEWIAEQTLGDLRALLPTGSSAAMGVSRIAQAPSLHIARQPFPERLPARFGLFAENCAASYAWRASPPLSGCALRAAVRAADGEPAPRSLIWGAEKPASNPADQSDHQSPGNG
jgi:hypothetical protein